MNGATRIRTRRFRFSRAAALVVATLLSPLLAAGTDVYGKPLRGLSPVPLAELVSSPGTYAGKTVRTGGRVVSVAGKGGFTLEEAGKSLRVAFRDPSVTLPQGAVGASGAVEGLFSLQDGNALLEASGAELSRPGTP